MRTTIILDEALLKEARRHSKADSVSAVIREALAEYIALRKSHQMLKLEGHIDIDPDWRTGERAELAEGSVRRPIENRRSGRSRKRSSARRSRNG